MATIKTPQDFPTAAKQFYAVPLIRRGKQISRVIRQLEHLHAQGVPVNAVQPAQMQPLHLVVPPVPAAPIVPAATRFGRFMQGVGSFFTHARTCFMQGVGSFFTHARTFIGQAREFISNTLQNLRARLVARRERRETRLHARLGQLITSYLHDHYRTDIYQRYEKAAPDTRAHMLALGRRHIRHLLNVLARDNLGSHQNAFRFNRPFFSACGWGVTTVAAASVFGASAFKAVQLTSNLWQAVQTNNLPLIGAATSPVLPVAAAVAGAMVMAYSIWRLVESVNAYLTERNAWIVNPLHESATAALNEAEPLRRN
jgi:hypothetical protein